jgi:Linalool dehydratase/isomerase
MTNNAPQLGERSLGWLRYLHRKALTPDDWRRDGEPHEWWDNKSTPPVLSFHRFDLIESTYALNLMADITPAWREVYTDILDQLIMRYPTFWGASDWLTQIGDDPEREHYPQDWLDTWIPEHLRGKYNTPGWTANGIEPWGLDPDPIGAKGNLFFRGNLNLMLSAHLYVSGERKWNDPFAVTGYDDATFSWTHDSLVDYLTTDWESRPEGPHCENTKIWPFCLTMAGLGLHQYDTMLGTGRSDVFREWLEFARKNYMSVSLGGALEWLAAYYDPIVNHLHKGGPTSGLGMAFYLLPQDRKLAECFYYTAVEKIGWNNPKKPVRSLPDPRFVLLGVVLARELGDDITFEHLSSFIEQHYQPGFDNERGEFGWGFGFNEPYPRGQLNALLIMAETGAEGSWWNVYNKPKLSKFDEPTLEGVDFPRLGIRSAFFEAAESVLKITTDVGTPGSRDAGTTFRITRLPADSTVRVRCNGQEYQHWKRLSPTSIEIDSTLTQRSFEILTDSASKVSESSGRDDTTAGRSPSKHARAHPAAQARQLAIRANTIRAASSQLVTQPAGCPCCSL